MAVTATREFPKLFQPIANLDRAIQENLHKVTEGHSRYEPVIALVTINVPGDEPLRLPSVRYGLYIFAKDVHGDSIVTAVASSKEDGPMAKGLLLETAKAALEALGLKYKVVEITRNLTFRD